VYPVTRILRVRRLESKSNFLSAIKRKDKYDHGFCRVSTAINQHRTKEFQPFLAAGVKSTILCMQRDSAETFASKQFYAGYAPAVFAISALAFSLICPAALRAQETKAATTNYFVKLVCESADKIATVRFDGTSAKMTATADTRILQSDISGPHGIAFSPDKKIYFVSIGHGRPYGFAVKYSANDDREIGQLQLGMFPATADVSPDGNFVYIVNFNLHGDPLPSSVSVVDANVLQEVARIPTCVMPHGSRVSRDGLHQYSACMMDDELVEVDAERMRVARTFRVTKGSERGFAGLMPRDTMANADASPAEVLHSATDAAGTNRGSMKQDEIHRDTMDHGAMTMTMSVNACSPTWAQPSLDGKRVWVACNKSNEIVEVDAEKWSLVRRIPAGNGVYNLGVSPDGKYLIATNKRDASVSIFDAESGTELARLKTKRRVVHGVVVSPDSRYAFVTVEGIGSEPGTVEIIDLLARKTVATVDTPEQAAGIDFWKVE
jgi:DNA-binding beta-propeller fold protein YncE